MDIISLMQSLDRDSMKKSKRQNKRRSKKLAGEKNEAETRDKMDKMNDKLGESNNTRDFEVTSHKLEMDLIEADLTMKLQGENSNMDANSTENLSKGNASRGRKKRMKRSKKVKSTDEVQSTGQPKMDAGFTENPLEGKLSCETETKWKISGMAENEIDFQSMGLTKMDTGSTEILAERNVAAKRKRKRERKKKMKDLLKMETVNEVQSIDQTKKDVMSTENINEENVIGTGKGENESIKKSTAEVQSMDEHKLATEVTEYLTEGDLTRRRKKKRRKGKIKYETESIDQIQTHEESIENLTEEILTSKRKKKKKTKTKVKVQSVDQITIGTRLIENLTEGNASGGITRIGSTKATIEDEVKGIDQNKMDTGSVENLAIGISTSNRKRKRKCKKTQSTDAPESMSTVEKVLGSSTLPLELKRRCLPCENQSTCDPNILCGHNGEFQTKLIEVSNKVIVDEGKHYTKGGVFSTCIVNDAEYLYSKSVHIASFRRKLLVLDINGLLADVVKPAPKHCRGDACILGRAIFKRPFSYDFLKFCFQNFDVGIWSSRSREIIRKIVKYLLGDLQEKLLFCWDMSHCTQTGFKTLENHHKPLVCKELRRIWENDDPKSPWKKGAFDESNTLLVDDSPYKALLNPLHTAIFPSPYRYVDKNDNALGPGGEIRVYLEELAKSENVQKHVELYPFGRNAVDELNSSSGFYASVLHRMSARLEDKTHCSTRA